VVALHNAPEYFVVSGAPPVERAVEFAREAGAFKVTPLVVIQAHHSPLMGRDRARLARLRGRPTAAGAGRGESKVLVNPMRNIDRGIETRNLNAPRTVEELMARALMSTLPGNPSRVV
jgi:hypothetical protein